jgi:ubiquinone/menaquinone biosynthesis C-methylase UbiE
LVLSPERRFRIKIIVLKNNTMIKKLAIFLVALLTIFVGSILDISAQSDLSEGWEVKIMSERQPPKQIMDSIGVKKGMVIGEIGAGRGRFTVYLAREVGSTGKILANDIDENAINSLKNRISKLGFTNVQTILGKPNDPLFPEKSLDMAIMVWVYHMIEKPDELLKKVRLSLKPGASLVILDPNDAEIDEEFHIDRRSSNNKVPTIKVRIEKSAEESGFEIAKVYTFLPKDYIFILKPKN